MKLYKCGMTNAEVLSDAYAQSSPFNNDDLKSVAFEVIGKMVTVGNEDYGIEDNDEDGGTGGDVGTQVVDIIDKFSLQVVSFSKEEFQRQRVHGSCQRARAC